MYLLGCGRMTTAHGVKFSSHPILHFIFTFLHFYIFTLTRSDIDDLEVKVWTSANTALYDIVLEWHASFVT
jgi:hypothetical protein